MIEIRFVPQVNSKREPSSVMVEALCYKTEGRGF
jgi:hypothetical protein